MLRLRVRVVRAGSAAMQGTWMAGIGGLLLVLGVSGAGQAAAQTATDGTLIEPGGVQQAGRADDERVAALDLQQARGVALDSFEMREIVGHHIVAEHRAHVGAKRLEPMRGASSQGHGSFSRLVTMLASAW